MQLCKKSVDIFDVLHAAVLRPVLRAARPWYASYLRRGFIAVRFEQIELQLGCCNGCETEILQGFGGMPQHLPRIGKKRLAPGGGHREQHLRGGHLSPRHRCERPRHGGGDCIRIPIATALGNTLERLSLAVEEHRGAAEVHPWTEDLRK